TPGASPGADVGRDRALLLAARRQARDLALLDRVRTALARETDLPTIFRTVVAAIAQTFGYTQVSLYLREGEVLLLQQQVGYDRVLARIPVAEGVTGRVARTGRPVLLADVRADPAFLGAIDGIVSEVCVPLVDEGRVVGVLNLESTEGVRLAEDDLRLMTALAEQVGLAMGRARLYTALRAAEAKYRTLVEQLPAVIYINPIDKGGAGRYYSPQIEALVGYTADEWLADPHLGRSLLHPDDRERVLADGARSSATGAPFGAEYRLIRRDGRVIWIRDDSVVIRDDAGHPRFWQGLMRDITERKQAEEALRHSEERFRALVQHAGDVIAVLDAAGTTRYVSPAVERVLGHRPAALVGTVAFTRVHPDDLARVRHLFAELLHAPGATVAAPLRLQHADGSWRSIDATANNLLDEPSVRGIVVNYRDSTERQAIEERLAHQAFHDPLTGLPNRVLFLDRLDRALAHGNRRGGSVGLLFLDLDRFKVINDSLGHDVGDRLLVAVAARLRDCVRPQDLVARFGGDEFTILLRDLADAGEATGVAGRVIDALQAPFTVGGREIVTSASIGIVLRPPDGEPAAHLLRDADVAMYRAKARGRAHYAVFDPSMSAAALARLEGEHDLRRGLERGEFRVYYQPQVALATGRMTGMEALVRWAHPARGLLPPAEFIPLAEETGLILPLGRWVLTEACRQARAWQEQYPGAPAPIMSVNLSASQFQQPHLVAEVAQALREIALEPGRLQLELTESVVMEDALTTMATLRELKGLGVGLALDDFGTGYSSLSYLKRFPIDTLKVDKAFLAGRENDSADAAILAAVVSLGHALGMQVTGEGIESAEQLARVRALGCELGQGYYFAKPLPGDAAGRLVGSGRLAVDSSLALAGPAPQAAAWHR
ncbi:MAG: EAL domain-containing protein, partial [Chloroflexota bacterium]|nr:EAL domain-containing protein [Chloroflexota bacterium]